MSEQNEPRNLKYTKSHEWIRLDGELAVVGITDHAVEQLGDLAFVDLPEAGATAARDEAFGEIESTKTASQLFAPLSGEIVEVNTDLVENLESITGSPFDAGWMIKIRFSNAEELEGLLSYEDYRAHAESEDH